MQIFLNQLFSNLLLSLRSILSVTVTKNNLKSARPYNNSSLSISNKLHCNLQLCKVAELNFKLKGYFQSHIIALYHHLCLYTTVKCIKPHISIRRARGMSCAPPNIQYSCLLFIPSKMYGAPELIPVVTDSCCA